MSRRRSKMPPPVAEESVAEATDEIMTEATVTLGAESEVPVDAEHDAASSEGASSEVVDAEEVTSGEVASQDVDSGDTSSEDVASEDAPLHEGEVLAPEADDEDATESAGGDKPEPLVGNDPAQQLRLIEALIFASAATLDEKALAERLPEDADLEGLLSQLAELYAGRGVNLVKVAGGYAFRTAPDLAAKLQIEKVVQRKLSRASVETLAIIAYHQPVTRAEIEQIRGVGLSKGTLDLLFEQNWILPLGRRRAPGKPVTWGTTEFFLEHFGLGNLEDLPGFDDLKAAGLLDNRADVQIYRPDEPDLPLEGGDEDEPAEPLTGEEAPAEKAPVEEAPAEEAPAEEAPADGNDEPKAA
jgi:segregation and condensation protein B